MNIKLSNGREANVKQIDNDYYGNPRYVIHFLALGLKEYISISEHTGFSKYRGKDFGGGYVFQSYNVKEDLENVLPILKKYYREWCSE